MKEFNEAKTAENLEKILFKSLSDFGMLFETLVDHCFLFHHCLADKLVSYGQLIYCYKILFFVCYI